MDLLLFFTFRLTLSTAVTQGNLGGHDILPNGKPAITPHMHEIRSTVGLNYHSINTESLST